MLIKTFRMLAVVALIISTTVGFVYGRDMWPEPPPGQPEQMWSNVKYDPKLDDPFFHSNEWSYPVGVIVHSDGSVENVLGDNYRIESEIPKLKHTAQCFSNSRGSVHLIKFCTAKILNENVIELKFDHNSPAFDDSLIVRIRNGKFTCKYSTFYKKKEPLQSRIMWITTQQGLILNHSSYRKGGYIKGKIYYECDEKMYHHESRSKPSVQFRTRIVVKGVFKTILQ